jgi:phospholipase C
MTPVSRRQILGAAGAAGLWAATGGWRVPFGEAVAAGTVDPAAAGIEHIVVVMMENRSFDHFLGWLPGANGAQDTATARYPDRSGTLRANHHLTERMGCGHPDPDHSFHGGRFQLNGGAMDNFARGHNDDYGIGFYTEADRPFMAALARNYTTCDAYFCSYLGPTWPNRFFMHCAQNDRMRNGPGTATMPTIWDQLNQPGGPTGRYYYTDVPFLGLWGGKYKAISHRFAEFKADATAGRLPNVAYVEPSFVGAGAGRSNNDHPHCHIAAGDAFLSDVFHTLTAGPGWDRTVMIVTYDEWGGFYDHVVPPRVTPGIPIGAGPAAAANSDPDLVGGRVRLGFRVPCIIASPFTRGTDPAQPRIERRLYDHTSILKFVESRFGLRPLSQRDASTRRADPQNLAGALRLDHFDPSVPSGIPRTVPPAVSATGCSSGHASTADETWGPLVELAGRSGWELP